MNVAPDGSCVVVSHNDRSVLTRVDQATFSSSEIPLPGTEKARAVTFGAPGYAYAVLEYKPVAINLQTLVTTVVLYLDRAELSRFFSKSELVRCAFDAKTGRVVVDGAPLPVPMLVEE